MPYSDPTSFTVTPRSDDERDRDELIDRLIRKGLGEDVELAPEEQKAFDDIAGMKAQAQRDLAPFSRETPGESALFGRGSAPSIPTPGMSRQAAPPPPRPPAVPNLRRMAGANAPAPATPKDDPLSGLGGRIGRGITSAVEQNQPPDMVVSKRDAGIARPSAEQVRAEARDAARGAVGSTRPDMEILPGEAGIDEEHPVDPAVLGGLSSGLAPAIQSAAGRAAAKAMPGSSRAELGEVTVSPGQPDSAGLRDLAVESAAELHGLEPPPGWEESQKDAQSTLKGATFEPRADAAAAGLPQKASAAKRALAALQAGELEPPPEMTGQNRTVEGEPVASGPQRMATPTQAQSADAEWDAAEARDRKRRLIQGLIALAGAALGGSGPGMQMALNADIDSDVDALQRKREFQAKRRAEEETGKDRATAARYREEEMAAKRGERAAAAEEDDPTSRQSVAAQGFVRDRLKAAGVEVDEERVSQMTARDLERGGLSLVEGMARGRERAAEVDAITQRQQNVQEMRGEQRIDVERLRAELKRGRASAAGRAVRGDGPIEQQREDLAQAYVTAGMATDLNDAYQQVGTSPKEITRARGTYNSVRARYNLLEEGAEARVRGRETGESGAVAAPPGWVWPANRPAPANAISTMALKRNRAYEAISSALRGLNEVMPRISAASRAAGKLKAGSEDLKVAQRHSNVILGNLADAGPYGVLHEHDIEQLRPVTPNMTDLSAFLEAENSARALGATIQGEWRADMRGLGYEPEPRVQVRNKKTGRVGLVPASDAERHADLYELVEQSSAPAPAPFGH